MTDQRVELLDREDAAAAARMLADQQRALDRALRAGAHRAKPCECNGPAERDEEGQLTCWRCGRPKAAA